MKSRIAAFIFLLYSFNNAGAQSLYEVSLAEKTANSPLVIEGRIIEKSSFWNTTHTMIYTRNKVEVYKIFKGSLHEAFIEVITQGGEVDNEGVEVSEVLKLTPNQVGTFFLYPNRANIKSPVSLERLWDVYGSSQGFLRYDLKSETASAPFANYKSISKDLYGQITARTNRSFENKKPSFSVSPIKKNSRELNALAPVISSFTPAMVNAGSLLDPTNNILTITGSGFGTGSGSAAVLFDDADDGSGGTPFTVAYNDPLVISWSDTQIKIKVPTEAGTGALQVMDGGGTTATAPSNLEVLYSIQTAYDKETTLINANGTGGYTVSYSTNTAGSAINFDTDPAKLTFQRALATWKETTGANIIEGGTTTVQSVALDGVCTIMYDNLNTGMSPLGAGVLAVCLSWYSTCATSPGVNQARKREFEVVVRNPSVSSGSATFTNGPCPPNSVSTLALDMETVILHELGHALNLGHIIDNFSYAGGGYGKINPGKLMNYALVNSVRRITPDYSAKAGALYAITPQGAITGSCLSNGEMTPLTITTESKDDCPATFPVTATASGTVVNFDLVHATSNRFIDPAYTQIRCGSSQGAPVTNNAYYVFRTSASGLLSISVSGYTTTPSTVSSCGTILAEAATGIRLVIYQVSSCPAAGSFPTPFACRTISANGALSDVLGLSANTNYLLYLEGIENTKASFSMTIGGTVLPIKFQRFTGTVLKDYNRLDWMIDYSYNVKKLILEKSNNATEYSPIDSTDGSDLIPADFFNDNRPFAGKNFYRLVVINTNESKQYSNVVLLERSDKLLISVYPNPSSSLLSVEINTLTKGRYGFELYSSNGQLVSKQAYDIAAPRQIVRIPVANLSNGSYFLKISNEKNETVQNTTVTVSH